MPTSPTNTTTECENCKLLLCLISVRYIDWQKVADLLGQDKNTIIRRWMALKEESKVLGSGVNTIVEKKKCSNELADKNLRVCTPEKNVKNGREVRDVEDGIENLNVDEELEELEIKPRTEEVASDAVMEERGPEVVLEEAMLETEEVDESTSDREGSAPMSMSSDE